MKQGIRQTEKKRQVLHGNGNENINKNNQGPCPYSNMKTSFQKEKNDSQTVDGQKEKSKVIQVDPACIQPEYTSSSFSLATTT